MFKLIKLMVIQIIFFKLKFNFFNSNEYQLNLIMIGVIIYKNNQINYYANLLYYDANLYNN